jgi:hypothetical protein
MTTGPRKLNDFKLKVEHSSHDFNLQVIHGFA